MEHKQFSFLHFYNFYLPVPNYLPNLVRFGICLEGQSEIKRCVRRIITRAILVFWVFVGGATEPNFAIFSLFFDLFIFCPILTCLPNLVSFWVC